MPDMPRINQMWAFLSVDDDGDEGVIGYRDPKANWWVPLVAADEERVRIYREYAGEIAKLTGRPVRLVKFSAREDVETIGAAPEGPKHEAEGKNS